MGNIYLLPFPIKKKNLKYLKKVIILLRKNDSDEVVGVAKWSLFTHADPEEAVSKFWAPGQAKSLLI